ncbi:MAG: hypothetical protein WC455_27395 [Dehalococcoidia bacterium]|jgi:hypothetical protein
MRHWGALWAASIIVTLVVGLVAGSAITQARLARFIEAEMDRVDAQEDSVLSWKAKPGVIYGPVRAEINYVEPEEYDRAMGR